jgi:low affinity Fe/Cu permease
MKSRNPTSNSDRSLSASSAALQFEIDRKFALFAAKASRFAGSSQAFAIAFLSIMLWGIAGPYFQYSEAWQMIVNTGTTICTFLMVFVIQNSQNRDGLALQIKLDEIIRAIGGAKNAMIDLEGLSHEELAELKARFAKLGQKARHPPLTNVVLQPKQLNSTKIAPKN